jgi:cysteine desulfurase
VSEGRGRAEVRWPGYLDSASSEPLHPAAREAMVAALDTGWADPRRLHGHARNARLLLDNAREVVAESLGVRRDEVSFTASGTDAVHRGLLGLIPRSGARSTTILTSAVEHSSVLHARDWHTRRGGEGMVAASDHLGRPADGVWAAAREDEVGVAALQSANHEVGTVQDVAGAAAELGDIPLFVDACASMGRIPLPDGWSAAAGSAHKWGGPAGVGILLVRKGVRWASPFPGDDRVDERAPGFENVPAALGAAAALQAVVTERDEVNARQFALVDRIRAAVREIPDVEVVGDPVDRLPHVVTFSFLYVDGEAIVDALNRRGLAVASGSACTSSSLEPSHVLSAMGVLTHGNVRVSLTRETTDADVDQLLAALPDVVAQIRGEVGL